MLDGTTLAWTPKTPAMMRSHLLTTEKLLPSGSIKNLKQQLGSNKVENLLKSSTTASMNSKTSSIKPKSIEFTRSLKDVSLVEQEAWIIEDLLYVLMVLLLSLCFEVLLTRTAIGIGR